MSSPPPTTSDDAAERQQQPPRPPVQQQQQQQKRRATTSQLRDSQTNCIARLTRQNSVQFKHDDSSYSWYDDDGSSISASQQGDYRGDANHDHNNAPSCSSPNNSQVMGMEVLDLRPSEHHAVRHMEASSLVSLASSDNSGGGGQGRGGDEEGGIIHPLSPVKRPPPPVAAHVGCDGGGVNVPDHWQAAGSLFSGSAHKKTKQGQQQQQQQQQQRCASKRPAQGRRRSSVGSVVADGTFLLGESEEAYRALQKIMSRGASSSANDDEDGDIENDVVPDFDTNASFNSGGTGFWSEMGTVAIPPNNPIADDDRHHHQPPGYDVDASDDGSNHTNASRDSSALWDRMEECNTVMTESSPLTERERRRGRERRRMYVRRCARAMVGFVALAALTASTIYFIGEDGYDLTELLADGGGWIQSLFDGDLQEDRRHNNLRYRKLPQDVGATYQDGTPIPYLPLQGQDPFAHYNDEENLSRNRRAREERVLAQQERVRQRAAQRQARQTPESIRARRKQARTQLRQRTRREEEAKARGRRNAMVWDDNGMEDYYRDDQGVDEDVDRDRYLWNAQERGNYIGGIDRDEYLWNPPVEGMAEAPYLA